MTGRLLNRIRSTTDPDPLSKSSIFAMTGAVLGLSNLTCFLQMADADGRQDNCTTLGLWHPNNRDHPRIAERSIGTIPISDSKRKRAASSG